MTKTAEFDSSHDFFSKVKLVNVSPEIDALDFIDLREIKPVIYSPMHYFSVGDYIGKIGDFSK